MRNLGPLVGHGGKRGSLLIEPCLTQYSLLWVEGASRNCRKTVSGPCCHQYIVVSLYPSKMV